MNHCGPCVKRGTQEDIVDFERLHRHDHNPIQDAALRKATVARRNANILSAIKRGDPIVFGLPSLAWIVHSRKKNTNIDPFLWITLDMGRSIDSGARYTKFLAFALQYGLSLPTNTAVRSRARWRRRVLEKTDRNERPMQNILLFAFAFGFDPVELSIALNRHQPSSPILRKAHTVEGRGTMAERLGVNLSPKVGVRELEPA